LELRIDLTPVEMVRLKLLIRLQTVHSFTERIQIS